MAQLIQFKRGKSAGYDSRELAIQALEKINPKNYGEPYVVLYKDEESRIQSILALGIPGGYSIVSDSKGLGSSDAPAVPSVTAPEELQELLHTLVPGDTVIIKETITVGEDENAKTYEPGYYICDEAGKITQAATKDDVAAIKSEVESLNTAVSAAQSAADAAQSTADEAKSATEANAGNITNLTERLTTLETTVGALPADTDHYVENGELVVGTLEGDVFTEGESGNFYFKLAVKNATDDSIHNIYVDVQRLHDVYHGSKFIDVIGDTISLNETELGAAIDEKVNPVKDLIGDTEKLKNVEDQKVNTVADSIDSILGTIKQLQGGGAAINVDGTSLALNGEGKYAVVSVDGGEWE